MPSSGEAPLFALKQLKKADSKRAQLSRIWLGFIVFDVKRLIVCPGF